MILHGQKKLLLKKVLVMISFEIQILLQCATQNKPEETNLSVSFSISVYIAACFVTFGDHSVEKSEKMVIFSCVNGRGVERFNLTE